VKCVTIQWRGGSGCFKKKLTRLGGLPRNPRNSLLNRVRKSVKEKQECVTTDGRSMGLRLQVGHGVYWVRDKSQRQRPCPLKRGKPGAIRTTWGTDEPARHKSNHPAPRAFPALQNEDYASLGKLTEARFLGSNLRPFR
jgi:hypothetical protein